MIFCTSFQNQDRMPEVPIVEKKNEIRYSMMSTLQSGIAFSSKYRGEHVFRHTFATNCYYKSVNVKVLSKLLGHADVNVTYNIYVHLYGDGFDEMYSALVSEK